jgi:iron complex outermembrane recepter protein
MTRCVSRCACVAVVTLGMWVGQGAGARGAELTLGTLSGSVSGPDGARLPRTTVSIRNPETGTVVKVAASDRGSFRATLPEGQYEVTAELSGFEPATAAVSLLAGQATHLDLRLWLSGIQESVAVIGVAPRDGLAVSEIRESSARDAAEALTVIPGVNKLRKGGIANDVVLRGLQSQNLTIVIDGVRVQGACPNHMDPPAFHADLSEVDRIDVGKGPFDLKNGGSLGGAVNIVTKTPSDGLGLNANLAAGSYGFLNPSATLSYGQKRFAALAGYSFRTSDAYEDGHGERFTELTDYRPEAIDQRAFEIGTAWAKGYWVPADGHHLDIAYTRQDAEHVYYPYLQMDAVYDDTDRLSLGYTAQDLTRRLRSVSAQGYLTQVSHWMTNELRTSAGTAPRGYSMGTYAETRTLGARVEGQLSDLTVGVELVDRRWDARTELAMRQYAPQFSIPDVTIGTVGLFAELSTDLGDRLDLTLGGRIDRARSEADPALANTDLYFAYHGTRSTERTDTLPAGKVQLRYRASDSVALSLGLGHTARVPDASERYFTLQKMGTDRVGDPELDPSRHTGLDAALTFERPSGSLRAQLFASRVDDYITVRDQARIQQVAGVMNREARTFANVDATLLGGELQASGNLGSRLFLEGDVSLVRGRQEAQPDQGILSENLVEMPPALAHARLRFDDGAFWAVAEGVFAARQAEVDTDLGEEETPGYATANLSLGLRRGRLRATAGVYNLFDRYYVEHLSYWRDPFSSGIRVPEPGRNVFANVAVRF